MAKRSNLVDDLGTTRALMAKLSARAKTLEKKILAHGSGTLDGELYTAVCTPGTETTTVDWRKLAQICNANPAQIKYAEKVGRRRACVRIVGRK